MRGPRTVLHGTVPVSDDDSSGSCALPGEREVELLSQPREFVVPAAYHVSAVCDGYGSPTVTHTGADHSILPSAWVTLTK